MLDILTIVHGLADTRTAGRIRQVCRRLAAYQPSARVSISPNESIKYEFRVGSKLHRLDGPAIEYSDGTKCWYRRGIAHREYHPQWIDNIGTAYWVDGKIHREAGVSVIYGRNKTWCLRGISHRKTGPADIWNDNELWYTSGQLHRLDAPACLSGYMIRGKAHRISSPSVENWVVDGVLIRRRTTS